MSDRTSKRIKLLIVFIWTAEPQLRIIYSGPVLHAAKATQC